MHILPTGKIAFDTIGEMNFNLFNTIGLAINQEQHLYDQDTLQELHYKDKYIKSTVQDVPVYAGKNDIIFEPSKNYNLMATLFGYYIDKESASEDGDKIGYIAQGTEDTPDKEYHRIFVQTARFGRVESDWFLNGYLGFIDCIFKLDGQNVDIHNFDIKEVK